MLMTLFYFFKITIKLKNSNITLTSNRSILSLLLKLRWTIHFFYPIKIVRDNNKFSTSKYRRPTFSDVFTNFENFIPNSYKYALIFTLLHRAFTLCSNFELFHQEIENLKNTFRNNSYPVNFSDFCNKKYLNNLCVKKKVYLLASKKELTSFVLYLG